MKHNTSKYILAYIDMLGIKALIKNSDLKSVVSPMENIYSCINELISKLDFPDKTEDKIKIFSDNIIFARTVTDDFENQCINLSHIIGLVESFQVMSLYRNILVRGSIVIGELYIDDNFTIGKALVDAYYLEDNMAKYPRVIIDKSLSAMTQENAHIATDEDGYRFIDFLSMPGNDETYREICAKYKNNIQSGLSSKTDNKIIEKLKWCERYLDQHKQRSK